MSELGNAIGDYFKAQIETLKNWKDASHFERFVAIFNIVALAVVLALVTMRKKAIKLLGGKDFKSAIRSAYNRGKDKASSIRSRYSRSRR